MRALLFLMVASWLVAVAPTQATGQASTGSPGQAQDQSPAPGLDEAGRHHALAVRLFNEKKYDEALVAAKRAAELREKSLGAEHVATRASLYNLAQVYAAKGDYGAALKVLQRLLPIYEKVSQPGSEEVFRALEQIATFSFRERKPGDAEKAYKRNLELREAAAADSPQTAHALALLASFYHFTGRPDQAKPLYQRAVSIWEKGTAAPPSDYVTTVERYSCLLRKDDHDAEADELSIRAAEVMERRTGVPSAAGAGGPEMEVRGGVLNGKATAKPAPRYPEAARQAGQRGVVVVQVVVDESGRVILACAVSGPRGLREASENAAYGWRFTPTLLGVKPVKVTGTITFNFTLS